MIQYMLRATEAQHHLSNVMLVRCVMYSYLSVTSCKTYKTLNTGSAILLKEPSNPIQAITLSPLS